MMGILLDIATVIPAVPWIEREYGEIGSKNGRSWGRTKATA